MAILANHHMISRRFARHKAFEGIDKKEIGIESRANRIYLPVDQGLASKMGISHHPGGHIRLYYGAVKQVLDQIAEHSDPEVRTDKIRKLLDAMSIGFAKGDLYTNVPTGKSLEDIQRGIELAIHGHESYLQLNPRLHQSLRDLQRMASETGQEHLPQWFAIRGNAQRERLLSKAVKDNPDENITSGNKDLRGTPFAKFAPVDDVFQLPPSTPTNPSDVPSSPPPFVPTWLKGLTSPEGFTRSDPRFNGALPAFPALGQDVIGLGRLPPTTAAPSDPLVLKFDPFTGAPLPFSERSPILDPDPPNSGTPPLAMYAAAGLAALAVAPEFWPLWVGLGAMLAPTAPAYASGAHSGAGSNLGGVFADASPSNGFATNDLGPQTDGSKPVGLGLASPRADKANRPEDAADFAGRFGRWTNASAGIMPAPEMQGQPSASAAAAAAPEEVRRLTRVNATNAVTAAPFVAGSAPMPHLPPPGFNDRFGNWAALRGDGRTEPTSKPVEELADAWSHFTPPPIFGPDDPRNDAAEWFSRWIGPFMRAE